ncbi:Hypothetical protein, putative [Bodo saltans]|uniref:Uncharacterized protein n=1 Tax=Bodo saltans TaxID=75058 RepID=A0A0S4JG74_BODSA|nr:Hypothetical protein, putative [Bodo saltans]|eukprot:CUG89140.1 Hypothetical protein, putative [Bodo saltans]
MADIETGATPLVEANEVASQSVLPDITPQRVEDVTAAPSEAQRELEYFESVVRTATFADESCERCALREAAGDACPSLAVGASDGDGCAMKTEDQLHHIEDVTRYSIGNVEIKEREYIVAAWRVATDAQSSDDEGEQHAAAVGHTVPSSDDTKAIVASVVPEEAIATSEVPVTEELGAVGAESAAHNGGAPSSASDEITVQQEAQVSVEPSSRKSEEPSSSLTNRNVETDAAAAAPSDPSAQPTTADAAGSLGEGHHHDEAPDPSLWLPMPHHDETEPTTPYTDAPASVGSTAPSLAPPQPGDIEAAILQMIVQMEDMVRCIVVQDEGDAIVALLETCYSITALQQFHEGVLVLSEEETQRRYVVSAEEGYAWYSMEVDVAEAPTPSLVAANGVTVDDASTEAEPTMEMVMEHVVDAVEEPHHAEGTEVSEALLVEEVVEVLWRFVVDLRNEITEEELEMRDVLSIEMELDRDEIASNTRYVPNSPRQHDPNDADQGRYDNDDDDYEERDRPELQNVTSSSVNPNERLNETLLLQIDAAEQYERQALSKLRGLMWRYTEMAGDRITAAQAADMSDEKELSDSVRSLGSVVMCVLLEWEETMAAVWLSDARSHASPPVPPSSEGGPHSHYYRAPGLLQLQLTEESEPALLLEDAAETAGNESVARMRGNHDDEHGIYEDNDTGDGVAVPDAANLGRVTSAPLYSHNDNDGEELPSRELSDDEVEAAYRAVQQQQTVRDNIHRRQDLDDDESIERELLVLAADEERRGIVYFYASCVSEEYDWNLGGYMLKMKRVPLLEPYRPILPNSQSATPTEGALRALVKPRERHLPQHLRAPVPLSRAPSRTITNAMPLNFHPSPPNGATPRFSRQGHKEHASMTSPYSSTLSPSQIGGGDNRSTSRSISRITDLMPSNQEGSPRWRQYRTHPNPAAP